MFQARPLGALHSFRAFVMLTALMLASVLTLAPRAHCQSPNLQNVVGAIKIGRGNVAGSFGDVNTSASGRIDDVVNAVVSAMSAGSGNGGTIEILPGQYYTEGFFDLSLKPVQIILDAGCTITPRTSGATSVAWIATPHCSISGYGTILVDQWVNDQVAIRVTSGYAKLKDFRMNFAIATGHATSNPMVAVKFDGALEPLLDGVEVNPDKGVRILDGYHGHGGRVVNCRFRNTSTIGYGGSAPAVPRRKCWEVIRWLGPQFVTVSDNLIWGLGTVSTDELNECLYFQRDSDHAGSDPAIPDDEYQGSLVIKHNTIGFVACKSQLRLRGTLDWVCEGNNFNSSDGAIDAAGEGALVLDTESATSTGETGICGVGVVRGNIFEGCALSAASAIQAKRCKKVVFDGNNFHGGTTAKFVNLNIDDSSTLTFRNNYFDGDEQNTQWGVGFDSPGLTFIPRLISIQNNCGDGLLFGVCPGRLSINYATGASNWPQGAQYDDGSLNNWLSPISNKGNQPIVDLTTPVLTLPTDLYTLPAVPGSGTDYTAANKCLQILAARVNRMSLMNEMALGLAATSTDVLVDNTGGTADGTIVDVTNIGTLRDDIAEVALIINLVENPQKASTLEQTRRKYLVTMVQGLGQTGGFAAVDDSAISASASNLGVVATPCTDAASGKAYLATITQALKWNVRHVSASSNVSWRTSASN